MTLLVRKMKIKERMKLLNIMVSIFICLLIAAYSYQFSSIEKKAADTGGIPRSL